MPDGSEFGRRFDMTRRVSSWLSTVVGTALVGASLLSPSVAYSAESLAAQLKGATAGAAATGVEFLPAPTRNTRLFRQTVFADCEVPDEPEVCRFPFLRVGNNRLVELTTVACTNFGSESIFYLTTTMTPTEEAIFESTITILGPNSVAPSIGSPFYFTTGERIVIWSPLAGGPDPAYKCTIYGKISRTD